MTCVVCAVLVSILVADAQDTDSYEAAMKKLTLQLKDSLSSNKQRMPKLANPSCGAPRRSCLALAGPSSGVPYGRAGSGGLLYDELYERFCEQKNGA